ncbi:MAG TPA: hypothetical protein DEG43_08020 [Acidimicrobiaceae bacterium]|jgi:mono/diheme cytochrome c family protein|nr:hypothetical protein [Acidimicrobiaceae bacterium]
MIALMTTQRSVAYVIGAVIFIGAAFFIVSQMVKGRAELGSEIELAPNRKQYLPDEELEGPKLNAALWSAFGLLIIVALSLPLVWLGEPGREEGARKDFLHTFEHRGELLYSEGAQCVKCHGPEGSGGAASFVITDENGKYVDTVNWTAPALDTLMYRFSKAEVMDILNYGRPGTPMPAWGVVGGGPNTVQQLNNVIEYLWTVQLSPEEVRKRVDEAVAGIDADLAERMIATREANAANANVIDGNSEEFERLSIADELQLGEILFSLKGDSVGGNAFNCSRCHVAGDSYGKPWESIDTIARGRFGPDLVGIEQNLTEKQHYALVFTGSEAGKQYGASNIGSGRMPGFGVNANNGATDDRRKFGPAGIYSPEQIWAIVTYERNLSAVRAGAASGSSKDGGQ